MNRIIILMYNMIRIQHSGMKDRRLSLLILRKLLTKQNKDDYWNAFIWKEKCLEMHLFVGLCNNIKVQLFIVKTRNYTAWKHSPKKKNSFFLFFKIRHAHLGEARSHLSKLNNCKNDFLSWSTCYEHKGLFVI